MDIRAVVFDLDGVIFDTEKLYLEVWKEVFLEYGYNLEDEVYFSVMGKGRKRVKEIYIEKFGSRLKIDEMYIKKDEMLNERIYSDKNLLKKGVLEVLLFLKNNNYKIGIATSAKSDRVQQMLNDYNIYQFFDVIVTGEEVEKSKPSPDIYLKVIDKLLVKASNCLVIEDSLVGVQAGLRAGSQVIHIKDLVDIKNKDVISMKSILDIQNYLKKERLNSIVSYIDSFDEEANYFNLKNGKYFEEELKREIDIKHYLWGKKVKAIAKASSDDTVIFYDEDGEFTIVHLTYSSSNIKGFPRITLFNNITELKEYINKSN